MNQPYWSTVHVGGRRTEVLTLGVGTPVLFLHGWGLSPRAYLPTLRHLSRNGFQVIAPALPGFGHSAPLPLREQTVQGVATHLTGVLDALGVDTPVPVIGHSFGGGVALRLAATRPDLVKTLILACPVGGAGDGPVPVLKMIGGVLGDACHRWILRAVRDFGAAIARHPTSVVATAYSAWRSDQMSDIASIDQHGIPTRFLFADEDEVVTPGGIPVCTFPHVACETINGNHSWLLTDPATFAAHVLADLRETETPDGA